MEQPAVEPKEKTPHDVMVGSEPSQPIFHLSQRGARDQTQASQSAGTLCLHISLKIRIVKFASSQRLPELSGGTALKRDRAHHLEKVDDAVTVNRKVLHEENESLLQDLHAVAAQDLHSCWIRR